MDKQQAKKLYEHNKRYVSANIDNLSWKELLAFAKKQDNLYNIYNS